MAPRFVKVARPVEAGVRYVSSVPSALQGAIGRLLPANLTTTLSEKASGFADRVSSIKFFSDVHGFAASLLEALPPLKREVKLMLAAVATLLALRALFVHARSRWILINFGSAKVLSKKE